MFTVIIKGETYTAIPLGDDDLKPEHAPAMSDFDGDGIYFHDFRFWMVYRNH